jgi:hypothetical protein
MRVRFLSPAHIIAPNATSQGTLDVAELFEQADDKNGKAGHTSSMIMSARSTELPCQEFFLGR